MANSLKSRLLLNNFLMIFSVFLLMAAGLVLIFINNPASYRQSTLRLKLIETTLLDRISSEEINSPEKINELLIAETRASQVRFLIVSADQKIIFDTGKDQYPTINRARFNLGKILADEARLIPVRDDLNNRWLYTAARIDGQNFLISLIPRPILAVTNILRDDIFVALFRAIVISLVIAFALSLVTARWIAKPLQNLIGGVRSLAGGEFRALPLEGPGEMQELARAYNEMSMTVKENQQAQRDFIANVSHELKTPLTSIQGFAQSILDGATSQPEKLKDAGRIIYNEAQRMNRLVLDLLTLTRLESGIYDFNPTLLDLNEVLSGVVERFQPQAASAGLEVSFEPVGEIHLKADGDRLAQVFGNLIDNALKFTPRGGKISLSSRVVDGKAMVYVEDNGVGIPPAEISRIFERFYQVEKSRKGGIGHGSGLGLSIAEKIVRAHGGKISVESALEKGTKFTVVMPVDETKPG